MGWFSDVFSGLYITYTMASQDSPDMCPRPRACGPAGLGIYIRQIPHGHGIAINYDAARNTSSVVILIVLNI